MIQTLKVSGTLLQLPIHFDGMSIVFMPVIYVYATKFFCHCF